MRECPIALLILAPAPVDLPTQDAHLLSIPAAFGVFRRQRFTCLFIGGDFLLEFVNVAAGARLLDTPTSRVQEKRAAHLLVMLIKSGSSEQRMDAPVGTQDPFH